jgi:hypothetical protein
MVDVLLFGEDPGGVDVIVPLKKKFDAIGVTSRVLSSGPGTAVWLRHAIAFDDITAAVADPLQTSKVRSQLELHRPKVLVTATSFPRRVEKLFRREARVMGIPSVMVLDADRPDLYRTDREELESRPDLAVSIGPRMTAQLIGAGYDAEKVMTAGHLALADIAAAGRNIPSDQISTWKRGFMETSDSRELVVVFSENIARIFGEAGALAEFGYHEGIVIPGVLRAIAATASRFDLCYEIVVKLHPKEPPGDFHAVLDGLRCERLHLREVTACDNLRLIRASDHVFGMFSIIMVWSALLGQPTFSYQPNARRKNLLVTVEDGVVPCCWREAELDDMVARFLTDTQWRNHWNQRIAAWAPAPVEGVGAVVDRILRLAARAENLRSRLS